MAKIILTHEVSGLGSPGDIVEVKNGYARNYLLPRNFAFPWSKGSEKQVTLIKAARQSRVIATLDEAKARKEALEAKKIKIFAKTGKTGRLFGTIKNEDIAKAILTAGLGAVDKRKIEIATHIKSVGSYKAKIRLHDNVSATVELDVTSN